MAKTVKLIGQSAIITGGGRGLGRAIALAFCQEGAQLTLAARTHREIEDCAAEIKKLSGQCLPVRANVTNADELDSLVQSTLDTYGRIDILVNNAAIQGPIGPLVRNDEQAWIEALRVNLIGSFLCMRRVLPHMLQQRKGKIINLSGGGATSPRANFTAYAASKAAIVQLTETLSEEVAPFNVQVNAIAPGLLNTRMQQEVLESGNSAGDNALEEARVAKLNGTAALERAARLAVFLASEASDGLTGKLVSAQHDGWESWSPAEIKKLMSLPWLTLRRMDAFTLQPLLSKAERSALTAF